MATPLPLLRVKNLSTYFYTPEGTGRAVDGVDFELGSGETVGMVGESGCGKTVTALSILRLVPEPPGRIVAGEVLLNSHNLLSLSPEEMRRIRGNKISMIFQEPMTSLNPVLTIGFQIAEAIILHQQLPKRQAWQQVVAMLQLVGIATPERRAHDYPHQLSGGMRQRAMIAMALACRPQVLIADEPTTALDVTIQAQILDLMKRLKEELQMAVLIITHDLGIIAETAQRVVVMYAGKVVETAFVHRLFHHPRHPYTHGLLQSLPRLDQDRPQGKSRLQEIPGTVPSIYRLPTGCHFAPRCTRAQQRCHQQEPSLQELEAGHHFACFFPLP